MSSLGHDQLPDTHLPHLVEQLLESLGHFLLPQLPAAALLALFQTSKFLHSFVENAPFTYLRPAFERLLPPGLHGVAKWNHLQTMLLAYWHSVEGICGGGRGCLQNLSLGTRPAGLEHHMVSRLAKQRNGRVHNHPVPCS